MQQEPVLHPALLEYVQLLKKEDEKKPGGASQRRRDKITTLENFVYEPLVDGEMLEAHLKGTGNLVSSILDDIEDKCARSNHGQVWFSIEGTLTEENKDCITLSWVPWTLSRRQLSRALEGIAGGRQYCVLLMVKGQEKLFTSSFEEDDVTFFPPFSLNPEKEAMFYLPRNIPCLTYVVEVYSWVQEVTINPEHNPTHAICLRCPTMRPPEDDDDHDENEDCYPCLAISAANELIHPNELTPELLLSFYTLHYPGKTRGIYYPGAFVRRRYTATFLSCPLLGYSESRGLDYTLEEYADAQKNSPLMYTSFDEGRRVFTDRLLEFFNALLDENTDAKGRGLLIALLHDCFTSSDIALRKNVKGRLTKALETKLAAHQRTKFHCLYGDLLS
jgi:hypothetical protein